MFVCQCNFISIHALREEGDAGREGRRGRPGNFYPRPPRGGRLQLPHGCQPGLEFLSTPSARRATRYNRWTKRLHNHFYPRPPRGGRRDRHSKFKSITRFLSTPSARRATSAEAAANRAWQISIHALREEGDNSFQCSQSSRLDFYPRPPRGGRPYVAGYVTKKTYDFYPRPPRGGRLRHSSKLQQDKGYFYPRPPRGGRLCIPCACWLCPRFLSTPSARRATAHKCPHCAGLHISIHALREEGDLPWLSLCSAIGKFLSTPSARRATDAPLIWATSLMYFYPRPLRGGRQPSVSAPGCNYIFLSTPSARRAT